MIDNIKKSIMGTAQFDAKFPCLRKAQNFSVYPIGSGTFPEKIVIQSDKRFGKIEVSTGKTIMCSGRHSYSCNAGLQSDIMMGKAKEFIIPKGDLNPLIEFIKSTSKATGARGVIIDNSGAQNL